MTQGFSNSCNCSVVIAGLALAFVSSFTEQYALGYHLDGKILLIGILPYLIFAMGAVLLRSGVSMTHGVVLLALHTWLVITVRLGSAEPSLLITIPLLLAFAVLPLLFLALRRTHAQQANSWTSMP